MRALMLISLMLAGAAQAQVTQSIDVNTVPNTMVVDSSDVVLPPGCELRGPVNRSFGYYSTKGVMKALRKSAGDANVIVVTVLNTNSGIPMGGFGYRCPDLTAIIPSLKVFILPPK